jgi:hypothetical protein
VIKGYVFRSGNDWRAIVITLMTIRHYHIDNDFVIIKVRTIRHDVDDDWDVNRLLFLRLHTTHQLLFACLLLLLLLLLLLILTFSGENKNQASLLV